VPLLVATATSKNPGFLTGMLWGLKVFKFEKRGGVAMSKIGLAIASLLSTLLVGLSPLVAHSSDPCDFRVDGWTFDPSCGALFEDTTTITNFVDVRNQDGRISFSMRIVAPYGFSEISYSCGGRDGQTEFGITVRGGGLTTYATWGRADGNALPFPVTLTEYPMAGIQKSFEISGYFVVPKGTKSVEGACSHSSFVKTFDNSDFQADGGEWSFTVRGSNLGNSLTRPETQTIQKPKIIGSAKVFKTLRVKKQAWTGYPIPKLKYRWYACSKEVKSSKSAVPQSCKRIKGANGRVLRLTPRQSGMFVSALLIGERAGAADMKIFSKSTPRVG